VTVDERLNRMEDEITKLKSTINHNNSVMRLKDKELKELKGRVAKLELQVKAGAAGTTNINMGDIFGGSPFGGKR
jgi:archaellum component FlaC